MDQLSMDLVEKSDAQVLHEAITQETDSDYAELFSVSANKDQSISVKAKSALCAKIKLAGKTKYISVRKKHLGFFYDDAPSADTVLEDQNDSAAEADEYARIPINGFDDVLALVKPLSMVSVAVLSELGGEHYGCCSRYEICSDKGKCVNPNPMISLACAYKRNLEKGRVFYGINKTIGS